MTSSIEDTRRALGAVGAFLPVMPAMPVPLEAQCRAAQQFEADGYRAAWTNEVIGKDALVELGVLLAATDRMAFGTWIANIWARSPQTAHGAASVLAQAYPGRFVLGLGVGYPQQAAAVGRDFGRPLATMRSYLRDMDVAAQPPAAPSSYARIVGAMGPRMLALAGEASDGALPAGGDADATAHARQLLGPDRLLVVYTDVSLGEHEAVADLIRGHLAAGADHIVAGTTIGADFTTTVTRLHELAPALVDLR
jgi:probable F420-dependent oxidoreductase